MGESYRMRNLLSTEFGALDVTEGNSVCFARRYRLAGVSMLGSASSIPTLFQIDANVCSCAQIPNPVEFIRMNTSDEVIAAVRQMTEAKLREVHEATGVPMPTLAKIRYGVTADPRGSTLDKIRAYLRCHPPISEAA